MCFGTTDWVSLLLDYELDYNGDLLPRPYVRVPSLHCDLSLLPALAPHAHLVLPDRLAHHEQQHLGLRHSHTAAHTLTMVLPRRACAPCLSARRLGLIG